MKLLRLELVPLFALALLLHIANVTGLEGSENAHANAAYTNSVGLRVVRPPLSAVAPKGDEVVFECEFDIAPEFTKWRFRPASVDVWSSPTYRFTSGKEGYKVREEGKISKLCFVVANKTLGEYQCVAHLGSISVTSVAARLTLVTIGIDETADENAPTALTTRWNVAPNNCLLIRCGAVHSNPTAVWSFYRNGEKVPQMEVLPTSSGAGALILNSVTPNDSGNYTCSAMNAITGEELRLPQTIELDVNYMDRTAPYFLVQRPPTQVTALPGETALLECPGVGSPKPEAVWSSPYIPNIQNNRTKVLPYGLQIVDVRAEDQGSYVCRLDNGIAPVLVHMIKLNVLERPRILQNASRVRVIEGGQLELDCKAAGNPKPEVYWVHNGKDFRRFDEVTVEGGGVRMLIKATRKRNAGIVQCFAHNTVAEVEHSFLVEVEPKDIPGTPGKMGKKNERPKQRTKSTRMVPPSRPNITRLTDEAVMVRWNIPRRDGLGIRFFKVQYNVYDKDAPPLENPDDELWATHDGFIAFGRWERRNGQIVLPKNFATRVTNLSANVTYKFRVVASYSNFDNLEGETALFYLQDGASLGSANSPLPIPDLLEVAPHSPTELIVRWSLPSDADNDDDDDDNDDNDDDDGNGDGNGDSDDIAQANIDGFYVYYRPSALVADYEKAAVDYGSAREYKLDGLVEDTPYDIKMQSFNAEAGSEFSGLLQGRTRRKPAAPMSSAPSSPELGVALPALDANGDDNTITVVFASAISGALLFVGLCALACHMIAKRKSSSTDADDNKPQMDHIPSIFPVKAGGHHLNGVLPRMNITANPLAQAQDTTTADKNRNVMELRFMPPNPCATAAAAASLNANGNNLPPTTATATTSTSRTTATGTASITSDTAAGPKLMNGSLALGTQQCSSSSCETLEASEGVANEGLTPTPMLFANGKPPMPTPTPTSTPTVSSTLNTNAIGLHHAQPYYAPGTPLLLPKPREYQQLPPPVPPHQHQLHLNNNNNNTNNNNNNNNAFGQQFYQQQQQQQQAHQQSQTLDRSLRSPVDAAMGVDGLPPTTGNSNMSTRIPSLRRGTGARNAAANNAAQQQQQQQQQQQHYQHHPALGNGTGGGIIGIPFVPSSPRVQRSPMPARSMMKRTRLGSHTDNISSGSLNSIEV